MSAAVTVIDAGVGNLGNLARALRHLGAAVTVSDDPATIAAARCLVLPGVGAFRPPRERLRGALEAALEGALEGGAWLLGICVGFQLLFASSDEFGTTDGLGLLAGAVSKLPDDDGEGGGVLLPHIGWNRLFDLRPHPLLAGLDEGTEMYFVHSYAPGVGADDHDEHDGDEQCLARATHGTSFWAAAGSDRGRVLGTQFHPEKSGAAGLRLLGNYLELACS